MLATSAILFVVNEIIECDFVQSLTFTFRADGLGIKLSAPFIGCASHLFRLLQFDVFYQPLVITMTVAR